jgi:hypothetical protein
VRVELAQKFKASGIGMRREAHGMVDV